MWSMSTFIVQELTNAFQSESPPNPHDEATTVTNLVAQAAGPRADRVVVGQPSGTDLINARPASIQTHLLEALGLSELAGPKAILAT